jgi:hypothetical protein
MAAWNDDPKQCFVVSPIGERGTERFETFRDVLDRLIRPAIENSNIGLKVIRADDIHRPGSFIRDVLEYLASAYLVVVDLTGQNANVFYELGVRHALSPRTILIARQESDIPADLREYRTLIYSGSAADDDVFKQNLRNYLDEIEKTPDLPDNPVLSWLNPPRIPDDLRKSFTARITEAGGTQPEIVRFIQKKTGITGAGIAQSDLEGHFKKDPSEMYYRLEQLRLLGFISKERETGDDFVYRLSQEYRRELGLPEIVASLTLASQRGRRVPFGSSPDAPPAYFYYVRASNCRTVRLRQTRVILTRVRIFDATGSPVDDYNEKLQLKWQTATNRCSPRDIAPREDLIANLGFVIKTYGYFQLDVCADPWPQGFPGKVDRGQRMRVDLMAELAGVPVLAGLSLDITWDGTWSDDTAQMEAHLVVKNVSSR